MTKRILCVRHAEVDPRYQGRYLGSTDIPLSEEGISQCRALGRALGPLPRGASIWVSPMLRCRQTWQAAMEGVVEGAGEGAASSGSPPIHWLEELREIDFGHWEGKSFEEIQALDPASVERWARFDPGFSFPGGESLSRFVARVEEVRRRIIESASEEIVLVTHGGVIATLICLFLGLDPAKYIVFKIGRPSVSELAVFEDGGGVLESLSPWREGLGERGSARRMGEWPG